MAKTLQQYPTGQAQYRIEFDYLARPFVVVTLINSADQTQNKVLRVGADYTFLNATTLTMLASQTGFDIVQINRVTSSTPLVNFQDGSVLTAGDLTTSEVQAIHIAEEARDQTAEIAQSYSESAIQAAQEAQEVLDKILAMQAAGYSPVGTFEDGAVVTLPNQTVRLGTGTSTTFWRWDGQLPKTVPEASTPDSTGGVGVGKWVDVTDMTLRAQLAAADGYKLIGEVDNIVALRGVAPQTEGQLIKLKQHTAGSGLGGGFFRGTLSGGSLVDNNGTIIKATTGGGAWVRENAEVVTPMMFGALCRTDVSDHVALQRAYDSASAVDGMHRTFWIQDTVYWNMQSGTRKIMRNFILQASNLLPNMRPMVRIGNNHFVDNFVIDAGSQTAAANGTIGLVWEGGRPGYGGAVTNGDIKYTGSQGLYVSADYTANKYAERGLIDNIAFTQCGNRGTGNGRATLGADGTSNFTISNIDARSCNWGIYYRNDMGIAGVVRKSHNKLLNITLRGSGRTHPTMTDAQGISASYQDDLQILNVDVADFADNAIDMQYCDHSIVTNWRATACKDGVFMGDRSCRGHVISKGVAIECDRAIRLTTDGTYSMNGQVPQLADITIESVVARGCNFEGFWVRNSGKAVGSAMRNVKLLGCTADNTNTYQNTNNGHGFNIAGAEGLIMVGCYTLNTRKSGISVEDSEFVSIGKCQVTNADRGGSGTAGIDVMSVRGAIDECHVYGSSTAVGLRLRSGSHSAAIRGFRWRGVATGMDVQSGSSNVVNTDNLQW